MASLLFSGPPKDEDGNPKKLPRVAVYVAGATFAITAGLTLLVLPYVRQAARMTAGPQFLSNRHLLRKEAKTLLVVEPKLDQAASRAKGFNDKEERSLYGSLEGEHEPVSPWLGAQALGIATAVVFGSAGLGAWAVAKILGVKNMDEFSGKMREELSVRMPKLADAMKGEQKSDEAAQREDIEEWIKKMEDKARHA